MTVSATQPISVRGERCCWASRARRSAAPAWWAEKNSTARSGGPPRPGRAAVQTSSRAWTAWGALNRAAAKGIGVLLEYLLELGKTSLSSEVGLVEPVQGDGVGG